MKGTCLLPTERHLRSGRGPRLVQMSWSFPFSTCLAKLRVAKGRMSRVRL